MYIIYYIVERKKHNAQTYKNMKTLLYEKFLNNNFLETIIINLKTYLFIYIMNYIFVSRKLKEIPKKNKIIKLQESNLIFFKRM